jgi:preprotein translocase subunit SecB
MQEQIKITVSEKMKNILSKKAEKMGIPLATYCFNIIFEYTRKEVEENAKFT